MNSQPSLLDSSLASPTDGLQTRPSSLTMRCPRCQKLYSVESAQIKAASFADPSAVLKFQCVNESCGVKFQASVEASDATELGVVLQTRELSPAEDLPQPVQPPIRVAFERPKLNFNSDRPAVSNAVRTNAGAATRTAAPAVNFPQLEYEWERVLADYENQAAHGLFISACEKAGQLQFAAKKYSRILSVSPNEDVAKTMKARVIALVSYCAETRGRTEPNFGFRLPALNNFTFLLGSLLLVLGFLLPNVRNLAGLGFAFILLGVGVKYFLRRPI